MGAVYKVVLGLNSTLILLISLSQVFYGPWIKTILIDKQSPKSNFLENRKKLDNIVVKINYRLGIMGFMNTFDEEKGVPKGGNYGYMDQVAAIKAGLTTYT